MKPELCEVCGKRWHVSWTDHHGVAQCLDCGAPYRLFHYDESGKREEKPPEMILKDESAEHVAAFHRETGGRVSAVGMALSFPGGYDVATRENIDAWKEWMDKNHPPKLKEPDPC